MADDKILKDFKKALQSQGWTVQPKSMSVRESGFQFYIDVEAERAGQKIAVEVKSWLNDFNEDWFQAMGQYCTYQDVLGRKAPNYELWLVMAEDRYIEYGSTQLIQNLKRKNSIKFIIFNQYSNTITQWIP